MVIVREDGEVLTEMAESVIVMVEDGGAHADLTTNPQLIRLEVENDQGLYGRFFIQVKLNDRKQPVLTVTAKLKDDKEVIKSIVGRWKP